MWTPSTESWAYDESEHHTSFLKTLLWLPSHSNKAESMPASRACSLWKGTFTHWPFNPSWSSPAPAALGPIHLAGMLSTSGTTSLKIQLFTLPTSMPLSLLCFAVPQSTYCHLKYPIFSLIFYPTPALESKLWGQEFGFFSFAWFLSLLNPQHLVDAQ